LEVDISEVDISEVDIETQYHVLSKLSWTTYVVKHVCAALLLLQVATYNILKILLKMLTS
jgi:hypothetical protein